MNNQLKIKDINIYNFRGLNNLSIENLSTVNIFVGANNSGKTSVLEAIHLLAAPDDIGKLVNCALLRAEVSAEARKKKLVNYLLNIFQKVEEDGQRYYHMKLGVGLNGHQHVYEVDGTIGEQIDTLGNTKDTFQLAIKSSVDNGKVSYKSAEIINDAENTFVSTEKPLYPTLYLPSAISYYRMCAHFLSDYIVRVGKADVLRILQTFDENIEDISIVGEDIYLHNAMSGSMPLFAYGSGLQKATFLTIAILYCKDGTILVDEIDNAIHVSAFKDVFGWFLETCIKWNVQAFITTHSEEALDAILGVAHNKYSEEDVLRVITLRKDYKFNTTRTKIRTGKEAHSDRELFKMELRV